MGKRGFLHEARARANSAGWDLNLTTTRMGVRASVHWPRSKDKPPRRYAFALEETKKEAVRAVFQMAGIE